MGRIEAPDQKTKIFFVNCLADLLRIKRGAWFEILCLSPEHAAGYPHESWLVEKRELLREAK